MPRHGEQPARTAVLTLRFGAVELCPPGHRRAERLPAVTVWAVHVVEEYPPTGVEALEWLLLTTCAVPSSSEAQACVEWYACRFGIEVWHKVLKSGCRIEARQLESAARLQRCLTLFSVIAWRIVYATMLSRALPELPCTVLLALEEWQALYCATHHTATPPATPPTLHEAVQWIARYDLAMGAPDIRLRALAAGRIDATAVSTATWSTLSDKSGLAVLIDAGEFFRIAPVVQKVNVVPTGSLPENAATLRPS